MLNKSIEEALIQVSNILNEKKIPWMLIGSCNLAIQGMDLDPRDIDLCVNKKDFDKLEKIFSKFWKVVVSKFPSKFKGEAYKLTFFVDGVEIEFLGETSQNLYTTHLNSRGFIRKDFKGAVLNLNKLENEYKSYFNMERIDKANKIKEYLMPL